MYNIDSRTLKTNIGIFLYQSAEDNNQTVQEYVAYYYPLVLDIIVRALNNKHQTSEEAIGEELRSKYSDDTSLQLFYSTIYEEVREIKKQFYLAGFDNRMKYKLVERALPRSTIKFHAISMDLEATVESFLSTPETDNEDVSDAVIDYPSIDQLESMFDKR